MSDDEPVNILIVDDLPDKRLALQVALEGVGAHMITADSGREALRQLLGRDFAVILLDVNMPEMDGFETAALIRQRPRCEHTPIIFVTGYGDEMHAIQGYSLGAVDYILSPVVPEVLRTKVSVFVDLYRKTQQVRRQAEQQVALAREQAARAAAEESSRRLAILAETSTVLGNALDVAAARYGLLKAVVPRVADLAGVTLVEEDLPWQSEVAWVPTPGDPVQTSTLDAAHGPNDDLRAAIERVLATGRFERLEGLNVAFPPPPPGDTPPPGPPGRLRAAVVLPLLARGRTHGALTLALGPSGRCYSAADLALAQDLANRAAVALDNTRLYEALRESDRRKDEFLAMLAHELRNPLAPIRNSLQLLHLANADPEVAEEARAVMERQVGHMVRLIDDLLDVSRINRGKIELRLERVDAATVVQAAVETSRPLIEESRHTLAVTLPPAPVTLEADATRLAQVLANLLNNAAKYTPRGGRIAISTAREGGEVVFHVRDSGMGIPRPMLRSIFEPFTQMDRTLDRSQGGLGIGLTLVKRLVELHGGRVAAHSEGPGKGSEFSVYLPALPAGSAPPATAAAPGNGQPAAVVHGRPVRVFVVDDNIDAARSLATLLRHGGYDVRTFPDGQSALDALDQSPPDVTLLDIGLPGLSGYDVARAMRSRPNGASGVIVAVTGYGQPGDAERAKEAGFDHHLVKPVDPEAVLGLLASCVPTAP